MKETFFKQGMTILYLKSVVYSLKVKIITLRLFATSPRYRLLCRHSFYANILRFKLWRKRFIRDTLKPFFLGKEITEFEPTDLQLVYHSHSGPIRLKGHRRIVYHERFPKLTRHCTLNHLYKAIDSHPDINDGVFSMLNKDADTVFQDLVRKTQFVRNFNEMVAGFNERRK